VTDLPPYLRIMWTNEAKFLKAYYHWYLFRMYGPIPIVDKNLPISATPEEVKIYRQPVDSVVNYIVSLIDESVAVQDGGGLPLKITSNITDLGRITIVAALSLKARVLATAASPLFNGNNDFARMKNNNGVVLFNPTYDPQKWIRAEAACKAALDAASEAGLKLYRFNPQLLTVSPAIQLEMNIRNAVCEKWNSELIWGSTTEGDPTKWMQFYACPQFDPANFNTSFELKGKLAPPLKIAEMFYTKNGIPIEEDKTWDYANRYALRSTGSGSDYLQPNYQTVSLHFDREPRFYADLGFDGSRWFMKNGMFNIQSKIGQYSAKRQSRLYSITGYYNKKVVNWNLVARPTGTFYESYPWPVIRLSDIYLLYAEVLNENGKSAEALPYLNAIRERAGLQSVEQSWTQYSKFPDKYTSVTGLREIIQQERLIEMAFEGSRFWDLRRWKTAPKVLNSAIYGWDIEQSNYEDYNSRVLLFNQRFIAPRDYFWPIREYDIQINPNLVQNTGW
ncbi:MAG TPA: RagB/SusD family nutrient uptake outer membrane protein, partial [Niabella sp.]|nr:RagB/SusD family nutrient uptake outer membrane protein [Niabella sp.]